MPEPGKTIYRLLLEFIAGKLPDPFDNIALALVAGLSDDECKAIVKRIFAAF